MRIFSFEVAQERVGDQRLPLVAASFVQDLRRLMDRHPRAIGPNAGHRIEAFGYGNHARQMVCPGLLTYRGSLIHPSVHDDGAQSPSRAQNRCSAPVAELKCE